MISFPYQVYESLKFKLSLEFPSRYPYVAPTVKFVTPIFHPNVDQDGNICLDILKEKWSALYDVSSLLMSLQILLGGKLVIWTQLCNIISFFSLFNGLLWLQWLRKKKLKYVLDFSYYKRVWMEVFMPLLLWLTRRIGIWSLWYTFYL